MATVNAILNKIPRPKLSAAAQSVRVSRSFVGRKGKARRLVRRKKKRGEQKKKQWRLTEQMVTRLYHLTTNLDCCAVLSKPWQESFLADLICWRRGYVMFDIRCQVGGKEFENDSSNCLWEVFQSTNHFSSWSVCWRRSKTKIKNIKNPNFSVLGSLTARGCACKVVKKGRSKMVTPPSNFQINYQITTYGRGPFGLK